MADRPQRTVQIMTLRSLRQELGGSTLGVPAAAAQTPPAVVGRDGALAGLRIEVSKALVFGRENADVIVDDSEISRQHARLHPVEGELELEDLGSLNGTFVNQKRIEARIRLNDGDLIRVGKTTLTVELPPKAAKTSLADWSNLAADARSGHVEAVGAPGRTRARTAAGIPREEMQPPLEDTATTKANQLWTFVLTSVALFMGVLDNLVVLFALPTIRKDLNANVQQLEWTVNAFTLTFAVFLLPAATLGDRFGRRRMFALGIALFSGSSIICALAPNVEALLIGRALQGLGGAFITPLSLTILSASFPAERRGLVLGAWSGIAGLAVAIGPVIGGAIVTAASWHWIFWINVPIGAIVAPLCLLRLRESFGPYDRLDLPGVLLASFGLLGVVFGVIRGSEVGWTSLQVVGALAAGGILTAAFIGWELRAPAPMLAMNLFRSRAFAAANAASLLMYFGMFGAIFLLTQFLQVAQGYSAVQGGLRTLPWTGMPIFISPFAGMLAERFGGRLLMAAGLALQAAALGWLALVLDPNVPYSHLVPPFVLAGVGMALFFAPVAVVILSAVRAEEEGQASGANNAIRELGGVFGVAVLATIFASYGSLLSPQQFSDGVVPATWVAAVVVAIGAVAALLIPRARAEEAPLAMTLVVPSFGRIAPGVTLVRPIASLGSPAAGGGTAARPPP